MIAAPANALLLELHQAVRIAGRRLDWRVRGRLEQAAAGVGLAARLGSITLEPATDAVIQERLRALLDIAREARVDWPAIVCIVNREG